jgi:hypothetical protein
MATPAATISVFWGTEDDWSWRVTWNGGESDLVDGTQQITIELNTCAGLQPGQECWPIIEPSLGANHECGDNVSYDPNGGIAAYDISSDGTGISCSIR